MSLPDLFTRTRRPLRPQIMSEFLALPGSGRALNFVMQNQVPSEWCWAAVTTSLVRHHHPESPLTQCALVNTQFNRADCCVNGTSSQCNRPESLNRVLSRIGLLENMVSRAATFAELRTQIGNNRPLACRITWSGSSVVGHFVVLFGHSTDFSGPSPVDWVAVADPLFHGSEMPYLKFLTRYQDKVTTWTHSYFVRP